METPPPRRSKSYSKLSDHEGGTYSDGVPRRSSSHSHRLHEHKGSDREHSGGSDRERSSSSSSRNGGSSREHRSASKRNRTVLPPAQAEKVANGHSSYDLEGGGGFEDVELSPERGSSRKGRGGDKARTSRWPPRPLTVLAVCTVLFGPLGTLATFLLLPDDLIGSRKQPQGHSPGHAPVPSSAKPHMRVLHLSLAHSDVKARFVVDERTDWSAFLSGCTDRLKIGSVAMVTDATGEGIHSIADLVHEDNIIVHAGSDPYDGGASGNQSGTTYDAAAAAAAVAAAANPSSASAATTAASAANPANPAAAAAAAAATAAAAAAKPAAATSAMLHVGDAVCPSRHPDFRVAMLIPLLGPAPPYLPYFIASASRAAPLVDWLVFHEHQPLPWEPRQLPSNVKLVDLGGGGLAELVGLKLGERLGLPLRNATTLLRSLRLLFDKWPRLIAEYKPTFGTVRDAALMAAPTRERSARGDATSATRATVACVLTSATGGRHRHGSGAVGGSGAIGGSDAVPTLRFPRWLGPTRPRLLRRSSRTFWAITRIGATPTSTWSSATCRSTSNATSSNREPLRGRPLHSRRPRPSSTAVVRGLPPQPSSAAFLHSPRPRPSSTALFRGRLPRRPPGRRALCSPSRALTCRLPRYDIFTYSFGDTNALYLRGQWTVHRNRPEVNEIWRRCAHLGAELEHELNLKVGALRAGQSTRFLSAEGCYSYEALKADLRVKIATKQARPSSRQPPLHGSSLAAHFAALSTADLRRPHRR